MNGVPRPIAWSPLWLEEHPGEGMEHLLLGEQSADGLILAFDEEGAAYRFSYQLTWDEAWRLRGALFMVTDEAGVRSMRLVADGAGNWWDPQRGDLPQLAGCLDIDIWPTPFTNTFPIRRLELEREHRREIDAVYVAAPALQIDRMRQAYTRVDERHYAFESLDGTGFRAVIEVDDDGVVRDYPGLFRRLI